MASPPAAGLTIDAASREKLSITERELIDEKDLALECLGEK